MKTERADVFYFWLTFEAQWIYLFGYFMVLPYKRMQQVFWRWFAGVHWSLFSPPGSVRDGRCNYGVGATWVVWWMDLERKVPCATRNTTHGSKTTKQRPQVCCGSSKSAHLPMAKTPPITWIKKWVLAQSGPLQSVEMVGDSSSPVVLYNGMTTALLLCQGGCFFKGIYLSFFYQNHSRL